MNGSGCIFEHYGKIPESVYKIDVYRSPLEEAVFKNDVTTFKQLVQVCRTNCHQTMCSILFSFDLGSFHSSGNLKCP